MNNRLKSGYVQNTIRLLIALQVAWFVALPSGVLAESSNPSAKGPKGSGISQSPSALQQQTFCDSAPVQQAPWTTALSLPRFNPAAGTLLTVTLTLNQNISTTIRYENTTAVTTTVSATVDVTTTLTPPSGPAMSASGTVSDVAQMGPFDGSLDYSGTSGRTVDKANTSSSSQLATPLSDWTGSGSVSLPISAAAAINVVPPSPDVVPHMAARSGAQVCVTYQYDAGPTAVTLVNLSAASKMANESLPLVPAAIGLLGVLGVIGLGVALRRKG